jgi:hypothetical protein
MARLTLTLDDDLIRSMRCAAAARGVTVSRFASEVLRDRMRADDAYERTMRDFLAVEPSAGSGGRGRPGRDEVHRVDR